MDNKNQDRAQVKDEEMRQPTTADIARSGTEPLATTDQVAPAHRVPGDDNSSFAALLPGNETSQLRSRWTDIQAGFVDEPRHAVEQADTLVAEVMKRLAETFADERSKLEGQWSRGNDVSTEDLRVALRRYRSFFDRLLAL